MTEARRSSQLNRVLLELTRHGVLLHSNSKLPSVVSIIVGGPVRGSWWGHLNGHLIYDVSGDLDVHPDVLFCKLVSGKGTYIHRRLWSEFLAIALASEMWQMRGLSEEALSLLGEVDAEQEVRTDHTARSLRISGRLAGESARELERRLLVFGEDVHTAKGFHAKRLLTWRRWMEHREFVPLPVSTVKARGVFEALIHRWNREFGANAKLPWEG